MSRLGVRRRGRELDFDTDRPHCNIVLCDATPGKLCFSKSTSTSWTRSSRCFWFLSLVRLAVVFLVLDDIRKIPPAVSAHQLFFQYKTAQRSSAEGPCMRTRISKPLCWLYCLQSKKPHTTRPPRFAAGTALQGQVAMRKKNQSFCSTALCRLYILQHARLTPVSISLVAAFRLLRCNVRPDCNPDPSAVPPVTCPPCP